jgi:hypothetical protein
MGESWEKCASLTGPANCQLLSLSRSYLVRNKQLDYHRAMCTLPTLSGIRLSHLFRFFRPGSSKVCSGIDGCRIGKTGRASSLRIYRKTHASANVDGRTDHEDGSIQRRADKLRKNRQGSVSPQDFRDSTRGPCSALDSSEYPPQIRLQRILVSDGTRESVRKDSMSYSIFCKALFCYFLFVYLHYRLFHGIPG